MEKRKYLDIVCLGTGLGVIWAVVMTAGMVQTLEGDNCPQTYALFVDVARAVHSGSLWNPYLWGGFPGIGHSITEACYPINWLLCCIFYDADTALVSYAIIPWNLAIHLGVYFIGMYFLVKELKFSRLNAFSTGMMSTLCCALFYYRYWVIYLDGFCWLPLIILFSIRLYEAEPRHRLPNSLALGVLFAMEASVSISMMLAIGVYIFGAVFLSYLIGSSRKSALAYFGYSALAGVLGMLLAAVPLLNAVVFIGHMVRFVPDVGYLSWGEGIPLEEYSKYSYGPENLLQMLDFRSNVDIGVSLSAFVVLFGTVGLFCRKKRNARLYYIALAGTVITAMACFAVIFPAAFRLVPGLNQLREAALYGILLNLFAGILAAYGFNLAEEIILEGKRFGDQGKWPVLAAAAMACLAVVNVLAGDAACVLFVLLILPVVFLRRMRDESRRRRCFGLWTILLVGICGMDFYHALNVYPYTEPEAVRRVEGACRDTMELVEYVDALDPGETYYRMTDWGGVPCYPENMASVIGFYDVKGYLNPLVASAEAVHSILPLHKRAQLQNIKFYLVSADCPEQIIEEFEGNAGYILAGQAENVRRDYAGLERGTVSVYRTRNRLGAGWVVPAYEWNDMDSVEEILKKIAMDDFLLEEKAILRTCRLTEQEEADLAQGDGGILKAAVTCSAVSGNQVTYDVNSEAGGILVTADLYYPGWEVSVNGEKRTVLQVDGTNRGVVVPSGASIVEFRFRPIQLRAGIVLQLAAVLIIILIGVFRCRGTERGI